MGNLHNVTAPKRIQIRFADPWLIKALLEGTAVTTPEISLVQAGQNGFGGQGGGFGSGQSGNGSGAAGFGGGTSGGKGGLGAGQGSQGAGLLPPGWKVMINPGDNSLWLIPPR